MYIINIIHDGNVMQKYVCCLNRLKNWFCSGGLPRPIDESTVVIFNGRARRRIESINMI